MTTSEQKTIAIIQLTRMGDLIQTLVACSHLKALNPNYKLILLSRKQFSSPLSEVLKSTFDQFIDFDCDQIIEGATKPSDMIKSLDHTLSELSYLQIDELYNFSYSKSAAYLSGLVQAKQKFGPYINSRGIEVIEDVWSQYIYSNVLTGSLNPFNLVDLFKRVMRIPISEHIATIESDKNIEVRREIVIHPFASIQKKKWSSQKWVELVYNLLKTTDATLVIVGSKDEIRESKRIVGHQLLKKYETRITNITGSVQIGELIERIGKASLFIGHDSLVGHLAALHGIKSITVSLGPVRPSETTPYSKSSICVSPKTKCFPCKIADECTDFACHYDINYRVVCELANNMLNDNVEDLKDKLNIPELVMNSVSIGHSTISNVGMQILNKIDNNYLQVSETIKIINRIVWLFFLEQIEEKVNFPPISENCAKELANYKEGLKYAYELAEFGKKYSKFIYEESVKDKPSLDQIKNYSEKIDEIDKMLMNISSQFDLISPLINFNVIQKANLKGTTLKEISESSYFVYTDLATICEVSYELSENILLQFNKGQEGPEVKKEFLNGN